MSKKLYYQVVSIIFSFIGIMHMARIYYDWEAVMADVEIPMWVSWAAVIIAGYLAVRGFQFSKKY